MASTWLAGGLALAILAAGRTQQTTEEDETGTRGRAELAALVRDVLARQGEPAEVPLAPKEGVFGLTLAVVEAGGVRVLATTGAEEARHAARTAQAARALFLELTGTAVLYPTGLSLYLLGTSEAKEAFLTKHAAIDPEARRRFGKLEGAGIPGSVDWGFWEGDAEKRLDTVVRLALGWLLETQGVSLGRNAWLHEGLGFYLTHALVGTRLTWFVPLRANEGGREKGAIPLQTQMKELDADWLALARGLFAAGEKFDLEELLHLQANELDSRDYLRAHALAAYLVEVRRAVLPALVARLGADEDPRAVVEELLGFSLAELRTRLDGWLERRELLVARAEGRRSEAELLAQWRGLNAGQRAAAVSAFRSAVERLDTEQLRWQRAVLARADGEPGRTEAAPFYDPKVHAPAQPIPRKRLVSADARVKRLLADRAEPDPRAPLRTCVYDWLSGRVVRSGQADEPEVVFQNALRGVPPGADRACAAVLAALDHPRERKLQTAFAHAYTDREGNVFPVTLFDMWDSRTTIEMPDVDTLGIVHDALNEWKRWVAPVPGTQHDDLYGVIGKLYLACKRSRELRYTLSELFLAPSPPPRPGYETHLLNLHSLWAEHGSDPAKLAGVLPDGEGWEAFLTSLTERCKQDNAYSAQGRRRAAQLRKDVETLRKELGAAMDAAVAAAALGGDPPRR